MFHLMGVVVFTIILCFNLICICLSEDTTPLETWTSRMDCRMLQGWEVLAKLGVYVPTLECVKRVVNC